MQTAARSIAVQMDEEVAQERAEPSGGHDPEVIAVVRHI